MAPESASVRIRRFANPTSSMDHWDSDDGSRVPEDRRVGRTVVRWVRGASFRGNEERRRWAMGADGGRPRWADGRRLEDRPDSENHVAKSEN